jgi:hypothetical protein
LAMFQKRRHRRRSKFFSRFGFSFVTVHTGSRVRYAQVATAAFMPPNRRGRVRAIAPRTTPWPRRLYCNSKVRSCQFDGRCRFEPWREHRRAREPTWSLLKSSRWTYSSECLGANRSAHQPASRRQGASGAALVTWGAVISPRASSKWWRVIETSFGS